MSDVEETNRALEQHMVETKTRDVVFAGIWGVVIGLGAYVLLATGSSSSGGISPSLTSGEPWPVFGTLAGLVGGALAAHAIYRHRRQQRRRRFWGL